MRRRFALRSAIAIVAIVAPAVAGAVAQRTFVASTGSDANLCTLAQPCRSFASAIAQTSAGGEVIVLDSAGYGPATIAQSVSIIAPPGVHAGVTVTAGNGFTIAAGANDIVVLENLTIVGAGGNNGVRVNSAKEVHIENCTISNMQQEGVWVAGGTYVRIAGTTLRSNALSGVFVPPNLATSLSIDQTHAIRNGQAGFFLQGGFTTLRNSTAIGNVGHGLLSNPPSGAPLVTITNGEYSGNGSYGVFIVPDNEAQVRFSMFGSSVSRNATDGVVTSANGFGGSVVSASIGRSHITWNNGSGLWTGSGGINQNQVIVSHSAVSENGVYGVLANGAPGTVVRINANTIARNADYDIAETNSGSLYTFGNNALTGYGGANVLGSPTSKSLR